LLGAWLTAMHDAVRAHRGRMQTSDGRGLSAVFGQPEPGVDDPDSASPCVQAVREMVELAAQFDVERRARRRSASFMAVGIASGDVVVGCVNTPRWRDTVCVGVSVRRAGQLADLAAVTARCVQFDGRTHAAVPGRCGSVMPAASALHGPTRAGLAQALAAP